MHIFSPELLFRIGASSIFRDELIVLHGPAWALRGHHGEGLFWLFLMKLESLARAGVMTMASVDNLDDSSCFGGVCATCVGN
jgi:hypothetical protein